MDRERAVLDMLAIKQNCDCILARTTDRESNLETFLILRNLALISAKRHGGFTPLLLDGELNVGLYHAGELPDRGDHRAGGQGAWQEGGS